MPNIYDVAREAEVSIAAVSLVMNDPDTARVGKLKRLHIIETASKMGYSGNALAKALSRGSSRILGLVVPMRDPIFFNMFIAQVLAGIQASLIQHGYHLMIYSHETASGRITEAELFQSRYVDGVIVLNTRICSEQDITNTIHDLRHANIPFVMTNCYGQSRGINYVGADDEGIGKLAGEYLIGKGHKRIAMISGASCSPMSRQLIKGFTRALELKNRKLPDSLHVFSDYDEGTIRDTVKRWFSLAKQPTAIFCADDQLVPALYRVLAELGKQVPKDIAVLGRGDLGLATLVQPQLSTISVPAFDMGRSAADILIQTIASQKKKTTKLILPGTIMERAST
jgi:LacI family transcriptional regulator